MSTKQGPAQRTQPGNGRLDSHHPTCQRDVPGDGRLLALAKKRTLHRGVHWEFVFIE